MQSDVQRILHVIATKKPLQVLLKRAHTNIVFATKDEQVHLFLSEKITHTDHTDEGMFHVSIFGTREWISEALNGTMSLRRLQALNKVKVEGNYRQILLIDTLLMLSRQKN
ncbi:MAG: hypothetical protein ACI35P_14555 [Bacillus sp. (in: firmicutes)]